MLLIMGTKHLYGDIRPDRITPSQFDRLTEYMISFGYVPKVILGNDVDSSNNETGDVDTDVVDQSEKNRIAITFQPYQYPSRNF